MNKESSNYVYCSGPLFCPEEIAGMSVLSGELERAGFGTFLPQRDGLEAYVIDQLPKVGSLTPSSIRKAIDRAIFALDVYQLADRCDCLVFNMNGRVPDEGAAVEAGIAFACGKPIVLYKSDVRSAFGGLDNSMLTSLSRTAAVSDIHKLPHAVQTALKKADGAGTGKRDLSTQLETTIKRGRQVWQVLTRIPPGPAPSNQKVIEEIIGTMESRR